MAAFLDPQRDIRAAPDLPPTEARDHKIAEQSKNYGYSTDHQGVINAGTRLVVVVGQPLPGNRNDRRAWSESAATDVDDITATTSVAAVIRGEPP
jgi:hypothetical protein